MMMSSNPFDVPPLVRGEVPSVPALGTPERRTLSPDRPPAIAARQKASEEREEQIFGEGKKAKALKAKPAKKPARARKREKRQPAKPNRSRAQSKGARKSGGRR